MNAFRIFILSTVRPWRAWKFANRIMGEIPGAEICGIVQQAKEKLPQIQRLIALGHTDSSRLPVHASGNSSLETPSRSRQLTQRMLWWIHGCPRDLKDLKEFTLENLEENCKKAGWPFLPLETMGPADLLDFVRLQSAGLIVVLGGLPTDPELSAISLRGLIRTSNNEIKPEDLIAGSEVVIGVEHFIAASRSANTIASVTIPVQPYDAVLGFSLKLDLLSDDLLVQTAIGLQTGSTMQAGKMVADWTEEIVTPYLAQLNSSSRGNGPRSRQSRRFRRAWTLCLDTLLLIAPHSVAKNWNRRRQKQYPVLILAHHLVTDRPHRMGISTETFWGLIRFLQSHYRIVSLSEAVALLRSGVVDSPTVVLTFDDGYADNFVSLRAVAQEAEVPVTLFMATSPVDQHLEFEHDLAHADRGLLPLTWAQARYWSRRGAEFGSHTRTHFDCGATHQERLTTEIVTSRDELERRLEQPVKFFAFPFGQTGNMSDEAVAIAADTYEHFVSCFGGENLPGESRDAPQHLLRKNFYPDPWELELELQSIFDQVEKIKRKIRWKFMTAFDSSKTLKFESKR